MSNTYIGQYRYSPGVTYMERQMTVARDTYTPALLADEVASGSEQMSMQFKDFQITSDVTSSSDMLFEAGQKYYVSVSVPVNDIYDMGFSIKLVGSNDSYQYLGHLDVIKGGTSSNVYDVVLYQLGENVRAAVPAPVPVDTTKAEPGVLYQSGSRYYAVNGAGLLVPVTDCSVVKVPAAWRASSTPSRVTKEFAFTAGIRSNSLLFELQRQQIDYSIRSGGTNTDVYGRQIDVSQVSASVYRVNELLGGQIPQKSLTRIGVQGHNGLTLLVNGEPVKIGQSGIYELGVDGYDVTSLAVAAGSGTYVDGFIIDYQYVR